MFDNKVQNSMLCTELQKRHHLFRATLIKIYCIKNEVSLDTYNTTYESHLKKKKKKKKKISQIAKGHFSKITETAH